jgi:hypothetical protein
MELMHLLPDWAADAIDNRRFLQTEAPAVLRRASIERTLKYLRCSFFNVLVRQIQTLWICSVKVQDQRTKSEGCLVLRGGGA